LEWLLSLRREHELQDEVQLHIELLEEEYRQQGLSPADARAAARRQFGNVAGLKERRSVVLKIMKTGVAPAIMGVTLGLVGASVVAGILGSFAGPGGSLDSPAFAIVVLSTIPLVAFHVGAVPTRLDP
jgi:hypothetical protein